MTPAQGALTKVRRETKSASRAFLCFRLFLLLVYQLPEHLLPVVDEHFGDLVTVRVLIGAGMDPAPVETEDPGARQAGQDFTRPIVIV